MGIQKSDKSKYKEILLYALPAIAESILVALLVQVDTYMVSRLGTVAVASVALTNQPIKLILVIFTAINTAITKYVAEAVGRNDSDGANAIAKRGFWITLILSLFILIAGNIFAGPFMKLSGSNADTHDGAVQYFRIVLLGTVFSNISLYINAVKRGCQNSKTSLVSNIASNVINIIFDYLLIEGNLGFAPLGIKGAAIATAMGYFGSMIVSAVSLFSKKDMVSISGVRTCGNNLTGTVWKDFLTMSGTLFLEFVLTKIGFMLISMMLARIGTIELAVDRVAMNFLDIVFSFGSGLQAAALTMIGRSIGRNDMNEAKEYALDTLKIGMCIAFVLSILFLTFGKNTILLYFEWEYIYEYYATAIAILSAIIVLVQIPQLILNGILRGAGQSKYTMIISVITILVIQVPCNFLAIKVLDTGLIGKWVVSLMAQTIWCALLSARFVKVMRNYGKSESVI